jgi:predicted nucleic acid-binding protein
MGVVLDTSIWIEVMRGRLAPESIAAMTGDKAVYLSVISLGELAFGAELATDPGIRTQRLMALRQLEKRPSLSVTADTAGAYGLLAAATKQQGRQPRSRSNDLWIAAQAIEHNFSIMTLNVRDFTGLPGVQVLEPALM